MSEWYHELYHPLSQTAQRGYQRHLGCLELARQRLLPELVEEARAHCLGVLDEVRDTASMQ